MLEKWKSAVGNKKVFCALLMDLSNSFGCLTYELVIVKLNTYGLSMTALRQIQNHLSNRKQWTKIKTEYSSWEEILCESRSRKMSFYL